jgi:hypothetical protein
VTPSAGKHRSMERSLLFTKRKIKLAIGIGVVLLLIVCAPTMYDMGVAFGLWQPLHRPHGVPRTARYVSTLTTETWFDCRVDLARDVDVCRAWGPDGALLANGDYRIDGEDRAARQSELKPSMVNGRGGMGYMIYLFGKDGFDSKILVPVDSRHPHARGCEWDPKGNALSC